MIFSLGYFEFHVSGQKSGRNIQSGSRAQEIVLGWTQRWRFGNDLLKIEEAKISNSKLNRSILRLCVIMLAHTLHVKKLNADNYFVSF